MVSFVWSIAACSVINPTALARATQAARALPFVIDTRYREENWMDYESTEITISNDTTHEQRVELWCDVLIPIAGDDLERATVQDESGQVFAQPLVCPTAA